MPTCKQCGQEIEFRYVNGRCVPIHPGGGWHCGSFSEPIHFPPVRVSRAGEWREREFTRPTHCPECGGDVFFIRHNGGSVWVDDLGWPWPKHGCFDQPNQATHSFSLWTAKTSGLTNPKLGVIIRLKEDVRYAEPVLNIRFTDDSQASLILRYTPDTAALLGALVIISVEDNLLLHQQFAEIPFHSFSHIHKADANGWYTCPHCKASVREDTGHEEACGKRHVASQNVSNAIQQWDRKKNFFPAPKYGKKRRKLHRPERPLPAPTQWGQRPLTKSSKEQQKIHDAVERVAKESWDAVMAIESVDEQIRSAKRKAMEVIGMLSPSIRKQVAHLYTSQKWIPLLKRKPGGWK